MKNLLLCICWEESPGTLEQSARENERVARFENSATENKPPAVRSTDFSLIIYHFSLIIHLVIYHLNSKQKCKNYKMKDPLLRIEVRVKSCGKSARVRMATYVCGKPSLVQVERSFRISTPARRIRQDSMLR